MSESWLHYVWILTALCLNPDCTMPESWLHYAWILTTLCLNPHCTMFESSLHYASILTALCLNHHCTMPQSSLHYTCILTTLCPNLYYVWILTMLCLQPAWLLRCVPLFQMATPHPPPSTPQFLVPHLFLKMWQLVATEEDGHHVFLQVIVNIHGLTLVLLVPVLPCGDQATKHLAETKHTETGENSRQGCEEIQKLVGVGVGGMACCGQGEPTPCRCFNTQNLIFTCFFLDDQKLD